MNSERIVAILSERIGLNPASLGPAALPKLVAERMRETGIEDSDAYATFLSRDSNEFQALIEGSIVAESWFFRGGEVFAFMAKRIAARTLSAPFRVLSVPCCTGEEPYSLAMALQEEAVPPSKYSILGVDLSERVIAAARRGCYSEFSFRQTAPALKARYFNAETKGLQINASLRTAVDFRQGNLIDPKFLEGEAPFDLIFCRNVMIYLTPAARAQSLGNLKRLLSPDGLLGMGYAEPLTDPHFEQIEPREHFLFGRKNELVSDTQKKPTTLKAQKQPPPVTMPRAKPVAPSVAVEPRASKIDPWNEARRLANLGDTQAALEICRRLETSSAVTADVYHLMGVLHLAQGSRDEAGNCFRKALYLNPEHRETLVHLMHYHRELGDVKQAELYRQRWERLVGGGEE